MDNQSDLRQRRDTPQKTDAITPNAATSSPPSASLLSQMGNIGIFAGISLIFAIPQFFFLNPHKVIIPVYKPDDLLAGRGSFYVHTLLSIVNTIPIALCQAGFISFACQQLGSKLLLPLNLLPLGGACATLASCISILTLIAQLETPQWEEGKDWAQTCAGLANTLTVASWSITIIAAMVGIVEFMVKQPRKSL
ncbi:hypothetical protein BZG36_01069 [Bifiguratus adelaidae]|uniref:Uncharacterized protein n=1 Tax=Bifiguratus adelaidae TaxID=1938954 RepID=A0A261Y6F7_9FUNG|nr:hypothetical protein BZG36_01069 [Bifiguratus adelaidae]